MRLHRFIGDFNLKIGDLKIVDMDLVNQARNVLKLRVGERVILGDGRGSEGEAEIKEYGKDTVVFRVTEISVNQSEPDRQVTLYCSILKKENFELVVQKATEVGIKEIIPIITARTIKLDIRKDRLEKIIREASEQSGRGMVPVLHNPIDFKDAVKNANGGEANFLFDLSGESFKNFKLKIENSPCSVWVGPEGGWSPEEVELAKTTGFKVVSLGKTVLRAETAAIVGAYLIVHNF